MPATHHLPCTPAHPTSHHAHHSPATMPTLPATMPTTYCPTAHNAHHAPPPPPAELVGHLPRPAARGHAPPPPAGLPQAAAARPPGGARAGSSGRSRRSRRRCGARPPARSAGPPRPAGPLHRPDSPARPPARKLAPVAPCPGAQGQPTHPLPVAPAGQGRGATNGGRAGPTAAEAVPDPEDPLLQVRVRGGVGWGGRALSYPCALTCSLAAALTSHAPWLAPASARMSPLSPMPPPGAPQVSENGN
jgi:hypothetical protein